MFSEDQIKALSSMPQMVGLVQNLVALIPVVMASDCKCQACELIRGVLASVAGQ